MPPTLTCTLIAPKPAPFTVTTSPRRAAGDEILSMRAACAWACVGMTSSNSAIDARPRNRGKLPVLNVITEWLLHACCRTPVPTMPGPSTEPPGGLVLDGKRYPPDGRDAIL